MLDELRSALKENSVIIGSKQTIKHLKLKNVKLIVVANNCPVNVKKDIEYYSKLTGIKIENNVDQRIKAVKSEAKKINNVILLKGYVDVISDGKKLMLNKTCSPFMTKGGCGDTLTGICWAILARGIDTFTSACAAAFINGKAGELAAKEYGESLLPLDLIESIHKVIS